MGATESRVVDTVQDPSGKIQFLYNLPDDSCCNGSSYNYAFDSNWHCAEWHVDSTAKSFQFFLDSTEIPAIGFTGKAGANLSVASVSTTGSW